MTLHAIKGLEIAPPGAGDLIDRTVRLYRRHFLTLIRASAPPVIVSATGAVVITIANRGLMLTGEDARMLTYFLLLAFGFILWLAGVLLHWVVMGGASRNLVMHLVQGEAVSARAIYRNVRLRFFRLFIATILVGLWASIAGSIAGVAWLLLFWVASIILIIMGAASFPMWILVIVGIAAFLAASVAAILLFFLIVGRVAYVPQVMMVEGRGVFESIGRSFSLARGNVRRLTAMFIFTFFATWSATMLLIIPLGWYGYTQGVNPFAMSDAELPVWYSIGYEVVRQTATILIAPVWMLGLSLLYVDERVRHEGYDVELLASRIFGGASTRAVGASATTAPAFADLESPTESYVGASSSAFSDGSMLGLSNKR